LGPNEGQNIALGYAHERDAIADGWYNGEEPKYGKFGYPNPSANFSDIGHFTQMVWKATTAVGCFSQFCSNLYAAFGGATLLVCNYYPAGTFHTFGVFLQYTNIYIFVAGNVYYYYGQNVGYPLGKAVVHGIC